MNLLSHLLGSFCKVGRLLPAILFMHVFVVPVAALDSGAADETSCIKTTADVQSLFDSVNRCPVADAGADLPLILGTPIPLDASRSSDMDGQRLTFEWRLVRKPLGSGAKIEHSDRVFTQFTPDLAGDYTFEVRATDSQGASSVDRVTYSTDNVTPVANAGSDATHDVGEHIELDGARSYDLDGEVLAYQWTIVDRPENSTASLSSGNTPNTSLLLDQEGDYRIALNVKDAASSSEPSELILSTYNSAPVASAGRARTVGPNSTIIFDSSRSVDFDQDGLSYHWSVLTAPAGFKGAFDPAFSDSPSLTLGEEGFYLIQLIVDDGSAVSNAATALIEVKRDRITDFDLNDFLPLTTRAGADDTDGDGVADPIDNCVLVANAPQRDTDGDGIGNFCDPDLNNDGVVNFLDITAWTPSFLTNDEDADFNGDGVVNFLDYLIITNAFLQQPGPPGTIVWVSLVDGNFNDRTNWEPQIVPTAGSTAIIDVATDVTVTQTSGSINVKNLVQNESLVLSSVTFEATGALELGGTLSASFATLNNTLISPSLAGIGSVTLNAGTHTWSSNTLDVPVTLLNGANVNMSDGLIVNSELTIDAPSSPTGLVFLNDQTVSGTGSIIFDGVGNSVIQEPRLLPTGGTTILFDSNLTIRGGKGTIGQLSANVIVNGTVIADTLDETILVQGASWSGQGLLQAINGGGVSLAGTLDNASNSLAIDVGDGSLTLANGGALRNAIILGQPGSTMTVQPGVTTFDNLRFDGDINYINAANTNVFNGLTLNGTLLIDAPSSPTGLLFQNDQILSGAATITFDGVGNSVIQEPRLLPISGTTLTIDPTVTINGGKGTIGQSNASLVLNGTVNANVDGETILIAGNSWSGTGLISANNNGQVSFSGSLDNGGQAVTIDTSDGNLSLLNGASLRNVVVNGLAGTNMVVQPGVTNYEALEFTGDISMVNGASTNVTAGLTLNGTLTIDAPSSPTGLIFPETQTFDGAATVVFNGVGNSVVQEPRLLPTGASTILTIGADVTVRGGKGTIGQTNSNLVMLGSINADVSGEPIHIGGLDWSANGSFEASNGGSIVMFGGMDNGGSAIEIDTATGGFELSNGATLANAVFNGAAGTELVVSAGTTNFTAMTFNHDIRHVNSANSNVLGGLTINGTSTIEAPTSPTGYIFAETQSLSGTANVVFDSASNTVISEPRLLPTGVAGTVLTIDSSVTISGSKGTVGQTNRGLIMNGLVNANVAGQAIRIVGAPWSGTGTLNANNDGVIELQGNLDNSNQTLTIDTTGGSLTVLANSGLRNATLNGTAGTNVDFVAGSVNFEDLTVNGDLTLANGANITITDGLTLNGTATINAPNSPTGFLFANTQTLGGVATVVINGAGNSVISEPRLLPLGGAGDVVTIGSDVVIRGGVGTIGNTSRELVIEGRIVAEDGRLNVVGTSVTNNGVLEAQNTQLLNVSNLVSSPGELYAGAGSSIELTGALGDLVDSSVIRVDVDNSGVAGLIDASGSIVLDGTLSFNAIGGFSPGVGSGFTVITGMPTATFDTVTTSGLGAGETIDVVYNAGDVQAVVSN